MKVLLNGATGGTNFGDFLFAEAFQNKVIELIGKENVYWYDSRYALSDFFKKYLDYHNCYKLSEIDALICVSGGYFCGNDYSFKNYLIRYLMYFHICIRCLLRKIPIAIIGVEVGVPKNKIMQKIQKSILQRADVLIVRNEESLECLKNDYDLHNAKCTADSAYAIVDSLPHKEDDLNKEDRGSERNIFIHIDPLYLSRYERVIHTINEFLNRHSNYHVYVGTDQKCSNEDQIQRMCKKILCKHFEYIPYEYPTHLCEILMKMDFIITPKLHVGIVGATLGKSVISFSIHSEKVDRFYNQINEEDRTMSMNSFDEGKAIEMLERYHNRKIIIDDSLIKSSYRKFEYMDVFLKSLLSS